MSKATYFPAAIHVCIDWYILLLLVNDAFRFDRLIAALILRGKHEGLPVLVERVRVADACICVRV